jgi:hypothetical protein
VEKLRFFSGKESVNEVKTLVVVRQEVTTAG